MGTVEDFLVVLVVRIPRESREGCGADAGTGRARSVSDNSIDWLCR